MLRIYFGDAALCLFGGAYKIWNLFLLFQASKLLIVKMTKGFAYCLLSHELLAEMKRTCGFHWLLFV